jgi:DNA-binding transcriptional ArsR family regulator
MDHVKQFNALGHKGRTAIFRLLVRAGPGGACVDEIKKRLKIPGSTLSHHLDVLAHSGLIEPRRVGKFIYYTIDWPETGRLIEFLTDDCCADMHRQLGPRVSKLSLEPVRRKRGQL